MRWLVTGGAGFIGSHVVDAILDRGLGEVVIFDNLSRGRVANLHRHLANRNLSMVEGDIRNPGAVLEACRDVQVVLHLAACSNVMGSEAQSTDACETNVTGTLNVLKAAWEAGVAKLVFSSSREVYGDLEAVPVSEVAPLSPKNLYGASKVAGETYCSIFRQRGLDVRILRLANVYGPRDFDRVVPNWLESARTGADLEVYGGEQVLDLVWIDQVVEALIRAAKWKGLCGPVNIASGEGVRILQLADWIIAATHSSSVCRMLPAREHEVTGFVADVTRMTVELGIAPPSLPPRYLARMATSDSLLRAS